MVSAGSNMGVSLPRCMETHTNSCLTPRIVLPSCAGQRLAKAAYNTVPSYGGKAAFTGPTLSGCALSATSLTIEFDPAMLRGDKVWGL